MESVYSGIKLKWNVKIVYNCDRGNYGKQLLETKLWKHQ